MTDIQFRSFAEVFGAKLREQGIDVDPADLPDDPAACEAFAQGDGTHLAGTVLEVYVEAWTWETLKPYLEAALAATAGVEWSPDGEVEGGEVEGGDTAEQDAAASWIYELLCAAGLENAGLDPYNSPTRDYVVAFVEGGCTDTSMWPELVAVLESMGEEEREEARQALAAAVR